MYCPHLDTTLPQSSSDLAGDVQRAPLIGIISPRFTFSM